VRSMWSDRADLLRGRRLWRQRLYQGKVYGRLRGRERLPAGTVSRRTNHLLLAGGAASMHGSRDRRQQGWLRLREHLPKRPLCSRVQAALPKRERSDSLLGQYPSYCRMRHDDNVRLRVCGLRALRAAVGSALLPGSAGRGRSLQRGAGEFLHPGDLHLHGSCRRTVHPRRKLQIQSVHESGRL
jgi:hypothetical protein